MIRQLLLVAVGSAVACCFQGPQASAYTRGHSVRFEDVQRRANLDRANSRADDVAAPGIVIAPDVRLVTEGVLATGYDSNIDYLVEDEDGGVYGLADLGLGLIVGPADAQTTVVARGGYGRHDLENRPDRWDAGLLVDHYRVLGDGMALDAGAFFFRDDIDVDNSERSAGYYELTSKTETTSAFWRGRVMHTHYLTDDIGPVVSRRLFSRDETFDHTRFEQSGGAMFLKDQTLAPYFELGYAHLDYNRERNPSLFSRDGDEIWSIGGVRVTFSDRLHLDLGARYNQRWLDDPTISSHDSVFFDGKLVWTPTDHTYFEANIDRVLLEPIDEGSLLTDSTTYSLLTVTDIDDRTRLKLEVGHITEDQLGTPDKYQHLYGEARITYQLREGVELFGSINGYHSRNEATGLEADRVNTLAGVRFTN